MDRLGLVNFLFTPGASGTFVSNMITNALVAPLDYNYTPKIDNPNFLLVNEYVNPWMHIAGVWHPYIINEMPEVYDLKNSRWIIIDVTEEQYYFSSVINAIKVVHKSDMTKEELINNINDVINRDFLKSRYNAYSKNIEDIVERLKENNNVIRETFKNIFVDPKDATFNRMLAFNYGLDEINRSGLVDNIKSKCIKKYKLDRELYLMILEMAVNNDYSMIDTLLHVKERMDITRLSDL